MNNKLKVAILFGGQSSEHDVSCMSVKNVLNHLDTDKYEPVLIGITKEGSWKLVDSMEEIKSGTWRLSNRKAVLSPDATDQSVLCICDGQVEFIHIDVIFPVLHGMYGEDGTVQGLFELCRIPYVGCGVLSSSVCMDKFFTKLIVNTLNIRQAAYVPVFRRDVNQLDKAVARVEEKLAYPVFVKPSNAGSSQGVSQAFDGEELKKAIIEAAKHDTKILVEETIVGREIECAVLGKDPAKASGVGEILAADKFYSYEAKYFNQESKTDIRPEFPEGVMETIQRYALKIFRAVDGFGLARVDFFLEKDTDEVVFNEINTMPGFTAISMYPMLWEDKGYTKKELISALIECAFERNLD